MGTYYRLVCETCKTKVELDKSDSMVYLFSGLMPSIPNKLIQYRYEHHHLCNSVLFLLKHRAHEVALHGDIDEDSGYDYSSSYKEEFSKDF